VSDVLLEIEGLGATYGSAQALEGVSFSRGEEAIAVIGRNGMGKTTLCNSVMGIQPPNASGSVRFRGLELLGKPSYRVAGAGIAYVPQGRNIFPELSVRHNLELGGVALDDQAGLPDRIAAMMQRFPVLAEKAGAQASTLSGGQQKLLEVARGLLLDPKLMLIDEPSIGLSPALVQEVFAILKELRAKGVTILLIEQNAKLALEVSRRGYVMESGQIILSGDSAKLLHDPAVRAAYLGEGA
jgi:branched-chain amino acid transport system ATP-binding protein